MNKLIIIALALVAVINSVRCDSSEEVIDAFKSQYLRQYIITNRAHFDTGLEKLEERCPGVGDNLTQAILDFKKCDDQTDDSMSICTTVQAYTLNCTKPLLKVVDDCLPQKAKGLPTLSVKSFLSVIDYLCKLSGESIFELANPCIYEDPEGETPELDRCTKKVEDIGKKYKNNDDVPSTSEICSSVTDLRGCISTLVSNCKNQKTKDSVTGLYDALIKPCSHINEA